MTADILNGHFLNSPLLAQFGYCYCFDMVNGDMVIPEL